MNKVEMTSKIEGVPGALCKSVCNRWSGEWPRRKLFARSFMIFIKKKKVIHDFAQKKKVSYRRRSLRDYDHSSVLFRSVPFPPFRVATLQTARTTSSSQFHHWNTTQVHAKLF
jgi:hypothetical protein